MLNIGAGEMILILVVALLVLGPTRLPEMARGIGKFVREFRRQTDDVRSLVEREFYQMDSELNKPAHTIESPDAAPPQLEGSPEPMTDPTLTPVAGGDDAEPTQILGRPTQTTRVVEKRDIEGRPNEEKVERKG